MYQTLSSERSTKGPKVSFCSLKEVLDACEQPEWAANNGAIKLLVVRGPIPFELLRELEQYEIFPEGLIHPNSATLQSDYDAGIDGQLDNSSAVTLRLPRIVARHIVARNLTDLLTVPSANWQEPTAYFLVEEERSASPFCFVSPQPLDTAPPRIRRYHDALKLWTLLQSKADHISDTKSLMFFGLRRTELEANYDPADLDEDIAFEEISEFTNDQDRQDTRTEIFRSVLSELLRDQKTERGFAYLLRKSRLFARRLSEGLAIYLSTNSPEKLSEQAVAKHFELAEKLEKVITGMEAKSLTIPVAVLFAVKEVKFGERWVTLNTIIFISAALYFIAMTLAHFSQRAMLRLLKETIEKSTKDLQDQGLGGNPVLAESFKNLRKRQRNSSFGSWIMWLFSVGPLVAVIYAAFVAPPASNPKSTEPPMRIIPASLHQTVPVPSQPVRNIP